MAQLRQDHQKFVERQAQVIVVGPEDSKGFEAYWRQHDLPFIGLPDPKASVLKLYGQEVKLFKRRFWVLPGLRAIVLPDAATYLGTVFAADHDWHVFVDYSGLEVHRAPDAAYPIH